MAGNIIELHTEVPAELEANVFGQFVSKPFYSNQ